MIGLQQYSFSEVFPEKEDWLQIESAYDSTCFHAEQWFVYLKRAGYRPYVVKVTRDGKKVGYFCGERLWRGTWLVTAPFDGMGTYTQGLAMVCEVPSEERVNIYKQFAKWLFDNHIASFFQVDDWQLRQDRTEWDADLAARNELLDSKMLRYEVRPTLHVSLNKSVEELWVGLHYKSCKYSVNKARKLGLKAKRIDKMEDISSFVEVHYDQLLEVCHRKGFKPKAAQSKERMLALCEFLFPNRVLMVEVVGDDESGVQQVMSSGIFCLDKGECSYWTGASYQRYQKYCPNELMVWEAMRYISERGGGDLNFCGMASYKLKFGTIYAYVPRIVFTKREWIYKAKMLAKDLYHRTRKIIGIKR